MSHTGTNSNVRSNEIFGNSTSTSRVKPPSKTSSKISGVISANISSMAVGVKIGKKMNIEIDPSSPWYGISKKTVFNFSRTPAKDRKQGNYSSESKILYPI